MLKGAALVALGYALGYTQAVRSNEETLRTLSKLSDAVKEATRVMAEKDVDVKVEDEGQVSKPAYDVVRADIPEGE